MNECVKLFFVLPLLLLAMMSRLEQAVRDLERVENTAREARDSQRERGRERTVIRATAMGKGGRDWEGGDDVEARLRMLEQRTEQQQRDTSTIKVSQHLKLTGHVSIM